MRRASAVVLCLGAASLVVSLKAHAPSGAIFTTVVDGTEVNFNHYPSKEAVYLDGGPGPGAPQTAAGLDDGRYVFQVTDPPGKRLLSTDLAKCRQFDVFGGIITNVVTTGCEHNTGFDVDHGATTVQLMPYLDTPNMGGVYKVWAIRVRDFLDGCNALMTTTKRKGVPGSQTFDGGLDVVDCGFNAGNAHGFIPSHSKTDNYKVKATFIREIDTRFFTDSNLNGQKDDSEPWMDGLFVTWTDPLGGTNKKHSYWAPGLNIFHEAHVEAIEDGVHKIELADQAGCVVGHVHVDGAEAPQDGPQTVGIDISKLIKEKTWFIDVACVPQ
jgi:hypothetical protein